MSSDASSPDEDLRDVFRLLYADEEWTFTSDDEDQEEKHPPLNSLIPEIDLSTVESQIIGTGHDDEEDTEVISTKEKYTRKRFLDALDSLLYSPSSLGGTNKKARIFPLPKKHDEGNHGIILSTQPIPKLPNNRQYGQEYLPFSPLSLLSRLRSYEIHSYTFFDQNQYLSPIKSSLNGWINTKKDNLFCNSCKSNVNFNGLDEIKDLKIKQEVIRRLSKNLISSHKKDCPWRIRKSPDELYHQLRNLLHPLISSNLHPLSAALDKSIPSIASLSLKSSLNETEEDCLIRSVQQHYCPSTFFGDDIPVNSNPKPLSKQSILLSFFGWYPYFPNSLSNSDHIDQNSNSNSNGRTEIIHCRICKRRLGLWSFLQTQNNDQTKSVGGEKELDLVGAHLSWCPLNVLPGEKNWWEGTLLLREKNQISFEKGLVKDWVKTSDKLEKKPWRK
ncbi:uncharacterized protein L201_003916 [Kwoniella dendrophila CBS 6074]|uniref:C3HC-type domain-containing protein n=1 Tax=Kwoniella dendrophila CBS 6074 TaxID=1295534 RepID=A0AAX4JVR6_9TREE